jgi:hypothetical protein
MSAKHDKGVAWFMAVAKLMLIITAVRLLFAFGYHDVGFQIAMVLMGLVGGTLIFGGLAYGLGWFLTDNSVGHSSASIPISTKGSSPTPGAFGINLSSITAQASTSDDDAIYASIAQEIKSGTTDEGLWTRLFAECDGDENKTKAAYIKARAARLTAENKAALNYSIDQGGKSTTDGNPDEGMVATPSQGTHNEARTDDVWQAIGITAAILFVVLIGFVLAKPWQ